MVSAAQQAAPDWIKADTSCERRRGGSGHALTAAAAAAAAASVCTAGGHLGVARKAFLCRFLLFQHCIVVQAKEANPVLLPLRPLFTSRLVAVSVCAPAGPRGIA